MSGPPGARKPLALNRHANAVRLSTPLGARAARSAASRSLARTRRGHQHGGLKEKTLAAHRAGIKRVIVPERNKADVEEVPKEVRDELEFVYVTKLDDVLAAALETVPQPSQAYLDEQSRKEAQPTQN